MKVSEQTPQQVERTISKVADKFPTHVEATILTDIHLRANQETGELVAFDDDDKEITRTVIEQWIGNQDDTFYDDITQTIRKCIDRKKKMVEAMSIIKPFSFVLEDDEKENIAELYVVDDDTVIIDPDLMQDLDKDLNEFLEKLLREQRSCRPKALDIIQHKTAASLCSTFIMATKRGRSYLYQLYFNHYNIVFRAVVAQRFNLLNLFYDVKTFLYFTKHGVLVVEERRTSHRGISLLLLGGESRGALLAAYGLGGGYEFVLKFLKSGTVTAAAQVHYLRLVFGYKLVEHSLFLLHGQLTFHLLQFSGLVGLSPYYVKLAATALALRVNFVTKTCCAQSASLVEQLGIYKLCRYGIVGASRSKILSCRCSLAVRIAALNHKVLDDTME